MNGWLARFQGRRIRHLLQNGLILVGLGATSGCTCGSTDVVPDAGPPPTVLPTPSYEHIPVTYGPPPPPRDCKVPVDIPPEELLWGHPTEGLKIFNYTPIPCKSDPECHKLKGTGWYCDEGFHMGDRDCPVKKTPSCVEGERPKKQTKKPVD